MVAIVIHGGTRLKKTIATVRFVLAEAAGTTLRGVGELACSTTAQHAALQARGEATQRRSAQDGRGAAG